MKATTLLKIIFSVILLIFTAVGSVQASFYIPYIYGADSNYAGGDDNPYPAVGDFQYIDTSHPYGYSGAFSYTDGSNLSYTIGFTLYAPDNWDTPALQGGNDYTDYQPPVFGAGVTDVTAQSGASDFNDVYSYFYTITNTGTDAIAGLDIGYSNAALAGYGSQNDSDETPVSWNDDGDSLNITFNFGSGFLQNGETSKIYISSQSWYGFGTTEGSTGSTTATGGLPSPNPEAPVVALYVIGLLGMAGYTYRMKKHQEEVL